ncbi:hypothetical protein [Rhodomicrobium udaipurense]|uniref:Uncharacterized protein n=1 Tax=Rhodomicrobium udaipurense TaxID=1202716 RepID=A0A8I1GC27_9HYPH|nr:hypothetical protein [Rhodomicrobium udaipurense]MBJ7542144.1 hypothetical protein [Rhodomicrobium udaipurense]
MATHSVSMQGHALESDASSHHASAQSMMPEHKGGMGGCHKAPSKAPADACNGCGSKAKCTHDSCLCLKCFSAMVDVRPVALAAMTIPTRHILHRANRPPDSMRQPPAPPPQV